MKYVLTRMGLGEHQIDLPEESWIELSIVPVFVEGGHIYFAKTSLTELEEIRNKISMAYNTETFGNPPTRYRQSFSINGTSWEERVAGRGVCYLAWYTAKPEHQFFVPSCFADPEFFKVVPGEYGVFNMDNPQPCFYGLVNPGDPLEDIIRGIADVA